MIIPYPTLFYPWSEDDREIAFMCRVFGDERVEAMLGRFDEHLSALKAKTIAWHKLRGSYEATFIKPSGIAWKSTRDARLLQRAHDAGLRYLETHGEDIFRKLDLTFRMAARGDLSIEVGIPCYLLWAQGLHEDSTTTEARRIAIHLDRHELWVTSWLDWEGAAFLAVNPESHHYPDCFELNVCPVDELAIPQAWLSPPA